MVEMQTVPLMQRNGAVKLTGSKLGTDTVFLTITKFEESRFKVA